MCMAAPNVNALPVFGAVHVTMRQTLRRQRATGLHRVACHSISSDSVLANTTQKPCTSKPLP